MATVKVVIVDDEISATENIQFIIKQYCPNLKVVGVANSISSGIKTIKEQNPDLIFLDISMPPEGTGFDLLNLFPDRDFHVIFTTAHEEYSLQALKEHAFDYLLKPIDHNEVVRASNDFMAKFTKQLDQSQKKPSVITLSTEQGIHLIQTNDILYCKASGSYTEFHLLNTPNILISKPLKYAESILTTENFQRTHRSYLININHISRLIKDNGDFACVNNQNIPVSKKYFQSLQDLVLK